MRNFFSLFIGLAWLCPIFTALGQSNARTTQEEADDLMGYLDKSYVTSGILYNRVARTGWPAQGGPHRVARTGWPAQGGPHRVARTGWPAQGGPHRVFPAASLNIFSASEVSNSGHWLEARVLNTI